MQIIIPMSGFGERFRRAGYTVPKPLIDVNGKPIIAHVVAMFPGESDFLFICNQEHLDDARLALADTLKAAAPNGRIVGIAPHKLGPIGAVTMAREFVHRDTDVLVNYCDFYCDWDWQDFRSFVGETKCDGAVPAYRGFHPHSLNSTLYAYMRHDRLWMTDIQEKKSFTDRPIEEFASSGGYYFSSGDLCLSLFDEVIRRDLNVNGEYYVSLAMKVLAQARRPVAIYELAHFMQWGTPEDLEEYLAWSATFASLAAPSKPGPRHGGSVVIPMAGLGSRFSEAGYELPKPSIPVSGAPMVIQAARSLPEASHIRFILREDQLRTTKTPAELKDAFPNAEFVSLAAPTEGQAITCRLGMNGVDPEGPLTIGACDNGALYDADRLGALIASGSTDVIVWVVRGHPDARRRPESFGWVEVDREGRVLATRVKVRPADPARDPMIIGAFTFRRAADYARCCDSLVSRNGRVRGEFYVDELINDAVRLGLVCRIFDVEHYIGWGTPNDLRSFEYWQGCFHNWSAHPYTLYKDPMVPADQVEALVGKYRPSVPNRPAPWTAPRS